MYCWNFSAISVLYTGLCGSYLVLLFLSAKPMEFTEVHFCCYYDIYRNNCRGICESHTSRSFFINFVKYKFKRQKGRVKEMLCIVRQGFAEIPHSRKASLSHSRFRQLKFIFPGGRNRLHAAIHFQSEVV